MNLDRFTARLGLVRLIVVLTAVLLLSGSTVMAQCTIQITSPAIDQVFAPGDVLSIEWEYVGTCNCNSTSIYFSIDKGATWSTIVLNTSSAGGYKWVVPEVSSKQCLVRVCCNSLLIPDAFCVVSNPFAIIPEAPCSIDVTEPSAGASYEPGEIVPIVWESDCDCYMNLDYSTDAGETWTTVATGLPSSGKYGKWVAPHEPSDKCYLRVSCEDGSVEGLSGQFLIVRPDDCRVVADSTSLAWTSRHGCDSPDPVSIRLLSTCDGEFPVKIETRATWLDTDLHEGSTPMELNVTVDATNLAEGDHADTILVLYDGVDSPLAIPVALTVAANSAPQLQWTTTADVPSANTVAVGHGALLMVTFKGQDLDGDPLSLRAITPLPDGAVLGDAGEVSVVLVWSPVSVCDGQYEFGMEASDGCLADTALITIDVTNAPPIVSSNCDVMHVVERDSVICDVMIEDTDRGSLHITYRGVPNDARMRMIEGGGVRLEYETGPEDVDSVYEIVVTADDGCETAADTIRIIVENLPLQAQPPTGDERYVLIDAAPIIVQFNEPLQQSSLSGNAAAVSALGDRINMVYDSAQYQLLLSNDRLYLRELDTITVTLNTGIIDEAGYPLDQTYRLDFYTGVGVYPGDANDDGRVDERDIFPIGFHWHNTGPSRPDRELGWHLAPAHVTTQESTWDPLGGVYADADGSGMVDAEDICAIARNWTISGATGVDAETLSSRFKGGDDVMKQLYAAAVDCPESAGKQVVLSILETASDGDDPGEALPQRVELYPSYPNPFNAHSSVRFYLPESQPVQLLVYNLLGRKTATLIDGRLAAGYHVVEWDGRDDSGSEVGSGVYFYRLQTDTRTITKRMLLLK